jgi:queuine/archaeosine tRNA-ribosyltransferase
MDTKLRNVEDEIVNEALKYTGAHEGTTDAKEIQEVKDKVMANLATAYNLEKMRQALREFRSSLLAQKMSRYMPYLILLQNLIRKTFVHF